MKTKSKQSTISARNEQILALLTSIDEKQRKEKKVLLDKLRIHTKGKELVLENRK